MASLNTFDGNTPKQDWLRRFFDEPQEFMRRHSLGDRQLYAFCRFLHDAGLMEKKTPTSFASLIKNFGWDRDSALALMFTNMVNLNAQIRWFVETLSLDKVWSRAEVETKLLSIGLSQFSAGKIIRSFGQLSMTAFGTVLQFGKVTYVGRRLATLTRTQAKVTDGRVVLYALYKLAELRDERQFNFSSLLNMTESPAKIFGLTGEEFEQFLNGLSANFPEYIDATFTHDLEKISLMSDKTAEDVLKLFEV